MALPFNFPPAQGLYNPAQEHDACGVAMVATLTKTASHEIVEKALMALRNLERGRLHLGAVGEVYRDAAQLTGSGSRGSLARMNAPFLIEAT